MREHKTAIVIPCYNEDKRLHIFHINQLYENSDIDIFFANDGSTDNTINIIENIIQKDKNRLFLLNYKENQGKAHTVYKSLKHINSLDKYNYIGYFDADFSTPVNEVLRLKEKIENSNFEFVFGSRVLLLNSGIVRKHHRHVIGRIILTLININFKLGIYDTQCGAKIFSKNIIDKIFDKPFKTSWLFDVEVFIRLKKQNLLTTGKEIPISDWKDIAGSKLSWKSMFKILKEIIRLYRYY